MRYIRLVAWPAFVVAASGIEWWSYDGGSVGLAAGDLLIFGAGYCGRAIATAAAKSGFHVEATSRTTIPGGPGWSIIAFDGAAMAIARATHILVTAPPGDSGDPALAAYQATFAQAPALRWIGYLSTTGVYGDRDGGWVDETTPPAPGNPRSARRVTAESAWAAGRCATAESCRSRSRCRQSGLTLSLQCNGIGFTSSWCTGNRGYHQWHYPYLGE